VVVDCSSGRGRSDGAVDRRLLPGKTVEQPTFEADAAPLLQAVESVAREDVDVLESWQGALHSRLFQLGPLSCARSSSTLRPVGHGSPAGGARKL